MRTTTSVVVFFIYLQYKHVINEKMKRALLTLTIVIAGLSAYAQPRAMGIRIGATGLEAGYQHDIKKNQFIEGNLGLDFGTLSNAAPGVKATAIYSNLQLHLGTSCMDGAGYLGAVCRSRSHYGIRTRPGALYRRQGSHTV